ncbi:keratin, type I cytoskeletal 9-like [Acomys russatus]|uniref:keratin, type I cytoskeletal 9-like n=1 Tax=Acomys russatus TaxID=60746 RepID=UPI0021E275BC|nr:keratin, type I cytoskeletal 9-like [Acomys russatus]
MLRAAPQWWYYGSELFNSGRQRAAGRRVTGGARARCGRVGVCGVRAAGRERGAGRSRERSGGGGGRGGGGCVPAGPSCARGKERRPLGAVRDPDPPRGSGCREQELRGWRSAAWCMRGPQRRGGGGDGSGRGAGVAWVLVRRDSLS